MYRAWYLLGTKATVMFCVSEQGSEGYINFRPKSATGVGSTPLAGLGRSNSQSSERPLTERTTSSASLASLRAAGDSRSGRDR